VRGMKNQKAKRTSPKKNVYNGEILKVIKRPVYDIVTELIPKGEYGCDREMPITYARSKSGDYLGDTRTAYRLVNKWGISVFEKTDPNHCVCSVGYNLAKRKWFGWSHRAISSFKKKRDAIRFAHSVS
jgi:hypothetical protein